MTTILARRMWHAYGQLEATGIDVWQASRMNLNFAALIPVRPRLECDGLCDEPAGCNSCRIVWDALEIDRPASPDAAACLWEFLSHRSSTAEQILAFVRRWGTPEWGDDADTGGAGPGSLRLGDLRYDMIAVELLLQTLVATENDKLVDLDSLQGLWEAAGGYADYSSDEYQEYQAAVSALRAPLLAGVIDSEAWDDALRLAGSRTWHRYREQERRRGAGIEYQRHLVTWFLLSWSNAAYDQPTWDAGRRVVTAEVIGFKDLLGAQLRGIFSAPVIDVYVCSICGRPFLFEDRDSTRRPRRGSRRFCGPDCQEVARRASNRASWQRNKDRWRKRAPAHSTEGEAPR